MVLDTNIVIYATEPGSISLSCWLNHPEAEISVVTRIEALGFWRISAEQETLLTTLFGRLPQTELGPKISDRAIMLRQTRRMSLADAIIAATALEHGVPLVTRNMADFQNVHGLRLINPFEVA